MDPVLEAPLVGIWALLEKNVDGTIEKSEIEKLVALVSKALIADCDNESAKLVAQRSLLCYKPLGFSGFVTWLLQLAELFCNSDSPRHYAAFLVGLKARICRVSCKGPESERVTEAKTKLIRAPSGNIIEDQLNVQTSGVLVPIACSGGSEQDSTLDTKSCVVAATVAQLSPIDETMVHETLQDLDDVGCSNLTKDGMLGFRTDAAEPVLWDTRFGLKYFAGLSLEGLLLKRFSEHFRSTSKFRQALSSRLDKSSPTPVSETASGQASSVNRFWQDVPALWVIGAPLSGKTHISRFLAQELGCRYIDGELDAVSRDSLIAEIDSGAGFVVDGGHCNDQVVATLLHEDIKKICHFVYLRCGREDTEYRVYSSWVNRNTGDKLTGKQYQELVDRVSTRDAPTREEGVGEDLAPAGEDNGGTEKAENDEEAEEAKPPDAVLDGFVRLDVSPAALSAEIDAGEKVYKSLASYNSGENVTALSALRDLQDIEHELLLRIADGDTSQANSLRRFPLLHSQFNRAKPLFVGGDGDSSPTLQDILCDVEILAPSQGVEEGATLDEGAGAQSELNEKVQAPRIYRNRQLGQWGTVCPVTRSEGNARYSALYRGLVYLCSDAEALEHFKDRPALYANKERKSPGRVVIVTDSQIDIPKSSDLFDKLSNSNSSWTFLRLAADEEYDGFCGKLRGIPDWAIKATSLVDPEAYFASMDSHDIAPRRVVLLSRAANTDEEGGEDGISAWHRTCTERQLCVSKLVVDAEDESSSKLFDEVHELLDCFSAAKGERNKRLWKVPDDVEDPRQFLGWSEHYCPVTLHDESRTVPGDEAISTCYGGVLYWFFDEAARAEFEDNPEKYTSRCADQPTVFVCIVGPECSGKTLLANEIANKFGYDVVSKSTIESARERIAQSTGIGGSSSSTRESAGEPTDSTGGDGDVAQGAEGSDREWIEAIKLATTSSEKSTGYILDGIVETERQLKLLRQEKISPSILVRTDLDEKVAIERTVESKFVWERPSLLSEPQPDSEPESGVEENGDVEAETTPEEEQEMRDQALLEFTENASRSFETLNDEVTKVVESLEGVCEISTVGMSSSWSLEHAKRRVLGAIDRKVRGSLKASHRAIRVPQALAMEMLRQGVVHSAPLGPYCPVALFEDQQLVRPDPGMDMVVYESQVFQPRDNDMCEALVADPETYCTQTADLSGVPSLAESCAILGASEEQTEEIDRVLSKRRMLCFSTHDALAFAHGYVDPHSGKPAYISRVSEAHGEKPGAPSSKGDPTAIGDAIGFYLDHNMCMDGWIISDLPESTDLLKYLCELKILPRVVFVSMDASRPASQNYRLGLAESFLSSKTTMRYLPSSLTTWQTQDEVEKVLQSSSTVTIPQVALCDSPDTDTFILTGLGLLKQFDVSRPMVAQGHCLVTFQESNALAVGSLDCAAVHKGSIFEFVDAQRLSRFVAAPEDYVSLVDEVSSAVVNQPPTPRTILKQGRLEEYVSVAILPALDKALDELASCRPKHPSLSASESALKMISLWLRTKSNISSEEFRERQEDRLRLFLEECQLCDKVASLASQGSAMRAARMKQLSSTVSEDLDRYHDLLTQSPEMFRSRFRLVPR